MRDSGFSSTGPNLAKSTCGHSGRLKGRPPAGGAGARAGAWVITPLTKACTSSWVMRPLGPDPRTLARSAPSSRANLRTEGLACGLNAGTSATGSSGTGAGRCIGSTTGAAAAGSRAAAGDGEICAAAGGLAPACCGKTGLEGAALAGCGAGASPSLASSSRIMLPSATLSPSLTLTSFTTPAAGEGISMVALSDSTVISEASLATESPGLTRISMTSTSLKSPMSGTLTSVMLDMVVPFTPLPDWACSDRCRIS